LHCQGLLALVVAEEEGEIVSAMQQLERREEKGEGEGEGTMS